MKILDLNDDIMSKVKHNIFLRKIMKHKEDNFNYEKMDWGDRAVENAHHYICLDDGRWAYSAVIAYCESKINFNLIRNRIPA
eukprot:SAG11_NODE_5452_length_1555_cov_4.319368_1_plen_82_part_00